MEAAKEDPLRAQEIEEELGGLWYFRYIAWREMRGLADEKERKAVEKRLAKYGRR